MSAHWNLKHGMCSTYKAWAEMRRRCENPKSHAWADYGGRGIRVCERWTTFENFYADMGDRPSGASLDRFPDNDGHYEPGNCRWASRSQQGRNKRNNSIHTAWGESKTCSEWAEDPRCTVPRETIKCRIARGWAVEDAVSLPALGHGHRLQLVSGDNAALRADLTAQVKQERETERRLFRELRIAA
jgi:hypothetical protein